MRFRVLLAVAIAPVLLLVLLGLLAGAIYFVPRFVVFVSDRGPSPAFAYSPVMERGLIDPAPEQPFTFPHDIHAGTLELDCLFCHRSVDEGAVATVPAVEQCMFCHSVIQPPGAAPVIEAAAQGQPITWVRVHRLPDHTHFWHEPHIRVLSEKMQVIASEVCATCHGDVKSMRQVEQIRSLKMGDCVDCHRANNAPTDCATCHF